MESSEVPGDSLRLAIRSSSTRRRSKELSLIRDKIIGDGFSAPQLEVLVSLLFSTYPAYIDRQSRRVTQECLRAIVRDSHSGASYVLRLLREESSKQGLAPSSIFVLLQWSSLLLEECAADAYLWDNDGLELITVTARFLDLLFSARTRNSVERQGLVVTRRALRQLFKSQHGQETACRSIVLHLTGKKTDLGYKAAMFLGTIAGVSARLSLTPKGRQPNGLMESPRIILENLKPQYFAFWAREVIGSKAVVQAYVANAFYDFFSDFVTAQDILAEIVPALEKALLRAPEVVLNGLIEPIFKPLPEQVDLSDILANHLMKPLLSSFKSTNVTIRNGALYALEVLLSQCKNDALVDKVCSELLSPLIGSKIASPEQRTLHSKALVFMPTSKERSLKICTGIAPVAAKETTETSLASEADALTTHFAFLFRSTDESLPSLMNVYTKSLADNKPAIQRLWALKCGDLLWSLRPIPQKEHLRQFLEGIMPRMLELFNEANLNPVPMAQSGTITSAYVLTSLASATQDILSKSSLKSQLQNTKVLETAIACEVKSSFLLNYKAFTKLSTETDFIWFTRALSACIPVLDSNPQSSNIRAWTQAFLYAMLASAVPFTVQRYAAKSLSDAYRARPTLISKSFIDGLWTWFRDVEADTKDSIAIAAQSGMDRSYVVLTSIVEPFPTEKAMSDKNRQSAQIDQFIDMLVLCRPEIIPKADWIEVCLKFGPDPGMIASTYPQQCIEKVNSVLESSNAHSFPSSTVELAAYNTFATLAFVSPEVICPLLTTQISADLNIQALTKFTSSDFMIARTPEGTPFVDVLSNKPSEVLDKGSHNYDTLKWEAELRAQVTNKQGQQKKLTADEKSKAEAQLAKESQIRKAVLALEFQLRRGVGTIESLAKGPPVDAEKWLLSSFDALLDILKAGAGLLIGSYGNDACIACSDLVAPRLGSLRQSIGLATLRAIGAVGIPDGLREEPLGELVTRTLYRLRIAGDQKAFDKVSLIYMLPLLCVVLDNHGVGTQDDDAADEQVTLALEFLPLHVHQFSSTSLPRSKVLSVLLRAMQRYTQHHRLIKDTVQDLVRHISGNISSTETEILLEGMIVPENLVRTAVLQAVRDSIDLTEMDFSEHVWLSCHDDVEENAFLGRAIWDENALEAEGTDTPKLIPYLESQDKKLRGSAARSIANAISIDGQEGRQTGSFGNTLNLLQEIYREKAKPKLPERDTFGMLKKTDMSDPWEFRQGIALTFKEIAPIWESRKLVPQMEFLIQSGALKDSSSAVRDAMVDSATSLIAIHGGEELEMLMRMFEVVLEASEEDKGYSDLVNEAVVILYGSLARHLPEGDVRLSKVVTRLLQTLSVPSETVQYAIAECLPPLVEKLAKETPGYVQSLQDTLLQSKKYAARRGAAYGLAGLAKGRGIAILREYRIMSSLKSAIENKKDQNSRQGALLAYELFSLILGRTFEPYVIQIVPHLITSFGDASADVRQACLDTAKVCFANLSSYGVKVILPTLLEGLEETQWRSKKGASDLLGAMAYLDPQQLAHSLPAIIPPLTNVLNDTHKEVRSSANRSLQRFGEVISNPEVKSIVSILLKALSDPTKYTEDALDSLIKVSFVHYLDSPSLALITRILERGLGDRSGTKRKASQIIGSLAHLTDRKDLVSHLPILVAGLRIAVVDPVPATRATSSKALGSLMEKLGEDALPDLIPSLMNTLKSDSGAGDRLGSAQALSEVLAGLGTARLEETLPTILQNTSSSRSAVREGFMSLFIFLPACFGNSFAVYLNRIIPPILAGLADEVESIRETSLRAGRLLVKNFATKAIDLLLPELDRGLSDDNYRIRLSSVELVGDLLFNLTGISAQAEKDEDEIGAVEASNSLLEVLGEDKRNKILSSLYICRCDTSGLVRSAAIAVWKALVASPRTLKELIPSLSQALIRRLASSNMEHKVIAGNALGELIRKAGDGVLATLLPTLEDSLKTSTDVDNKQGICIAMREIISSSSPDVLEEYEKTLISVVRSAIVDPDAEVRETAAEAFDSLQQVLGKKAVDQVLPHLLNLLRSSDDADVALSALLTLLTDDTRSNVILPKLVPTLLVSPITAFNAKAIASLAEVAPSAMTRRLPTVLNAIMDSIITSEDDVTAELESSFDAILTAMDEYDGLNNMMSVMLSLVKSDDHKKRANTCMRLNSFFGNAEVDFSRYYPDLIRVLLLSFDDRDAEVVKSAWTALTELMKRLKKEEMESLVSSTRQIVQQVGVAGHDLPGFCIPKGINAVLPIFIQGLMNGTSEQRIQAALAISDVIDRTSTDALRPFVTNITGPLIRIISERSVDIKCAILLTLNNLLEKVSIHLKPFLPQLQRTFAKSLADPNSELLRARAAKALGTLLTLKPRVDPLIAELLTGTKTPDTGVRNAMLKALYEVVSKAGENMSEASRNSILGLIDGEAGDADDSTSITYARLLGALVKNLPNTISGPLIKQRALASKLSNSSVLNLNSILVESPSTLAENFSSETTWVISQGIASKTPFISDNSVLAAGKYLLHRGENFSSEKDVSILESLAAVIGPGNASDTRRLSLVVLRTLCRQHPAIVAPHKGLFVTSVFASVRDMIIPIKLAAEAAFLGLFDVIDSESTEFDAYMAEEGPSLNPTTKKSMQDYFKRVVLRLAAQARERREAEGGQGSLGLSSDEAEDEREIWSVGKLEHGDVFSENA